MSDAPGQTSIHKHDKHKNKMAGRHVLTYFCKHASKQFITQTITTKSI